jgi:hypothetical protein
MRMKFGEGQTSGGEIDLKLDFLYLGLSLALNLSSNR